MGDWCTFNFERPTANDLFVYRAELVEFTAELTRSLSLPLAPDASAAVVEMFDITVGRALVNGENWQSGRGFVLSRVRLAAREAMRLAQIAGASEISASVLMAAWSHEIARTRAAERRKSVA